MTSLCSFEKYVAASGVPKDLCHFLGIGAKARLFDVCFRDLLIPIRSGVARRDSSPGLAPAALRGGPSLQR